ncbi:signal transduction histidine kinase [Methanoregula boonei 6A8]|uniref:Signal transduction histidine kinase n=1 Tax=Methanoregula boonei (strain DSM 21154 / JCM 14090 / 6A8) TaxID=456442 RepID=A7I816_METB6|nr:PAS domain S-box protein [Methanoregula boonei]ABS55877.1 signal transduction histidine kinase [Methanoregula boonei 6A8]
MVPETFSRGPAGDDGVYQLMFELSRDAVLNIEPFSGEISACNTASIQLFQASGKEELLAKNLLDLSPASQPDGQTSAQKAALVYEKALQSGQIAFSWRCRRCTGQEFPASVLVTSVETEGHKTLWVTIRDTSAMEHLRETHQATREQLAAAEEELRARYNELQNVENELRASETKYRMLAENTYDILYSIDPKGLFTYVGPQVARYGFTPMDFISHSIWEFIEEGDRKRIRAEAEKVFSSDKPIRAAFRVRNRAGTIVWLEDTSTLLKDPAGNIVARTGVLRDITEQKENEERIRKSEELYHSLAETSQDLIYVIDSDDRIEYVNSYAAASLGKTYHEIINMERCTIFPPGAGTSQCDYLQRVFVTGRPERHEGQIPFPEGTRWFDHALTPLKNPDGTVRAVLCVSRDITGLKETEKALTASLEAKDALLREIHHRVKNNMQVVIGLLHFQASTVSSPEIARIVLDTETRIRSMVLIHERLYKSDDFINVSLETYLRDLVNSLIHAYGTKTYINVEYSIDKIQIDQSTLLHLGLLITEVISNSIRHAFPGRSIGTISISFHRGENNGLTLCIHDDGIGIPESCMRGKASTVGLALIYLLGHDQLDGKIRIERDMGTTFTFTFHYALQKEEN